MKAIFACSPTPSHTDMSAVFKATEAQFEPLTEDRLDAVLAIERREPQPGIPRT